MGFFNFDFDRLQSIMNGAGNIIPPSVDGNIHPEVAAKNLGTNYRSINPELIYGFRKSNFIKSNVMNSVPTTARAAVYSGTSGDFGAAAPTAKALDYLYAELASHYGMSPETAYQEALANTAYQRSVKDMQAAGLNPAALFGSGKGSPADGVGSVRSASAGGGGSSRRSSGSSSGNGKVFSAGEFYGISAAAGLVSAIASKNPNAYWIGQTVAQGAMTAMNELFRK